MSKNNNCYNTMNTPTNLIPLTDSHLRLKRYKTPPPEYIVMFNEWSKTSEKMDHEDLDRSFFTFLNRSQKPDAKIALEYIKSNN